MPRFIDIYIKKLDELQKNIQEKMREFEKSPLYPLIKEEFTKNYIKLEKRDERYDGDVLAVDSGYRIANLDDGGVFYVVRAMAKSKNISKRVLETDYDFVSENDIEGRAIFGRISEHCEHIALLDAIKDGFEGIVLVDGSLYGRICHVPMEVELMSRRDLMAEYFSTLIHLLDTARKKKITIIGVSKESRTRFFKEYLLMELAKRICSENGIDCRNITDTISMALDRKKEALNEVKKIVRDTGIQIFEDIVYEIISRKPDFMFVKNFAQEEGYTIPLHLGPSKRLRRLYNEIEENVANAIKRRFPVCSENEDFIEKYREVFINLQEMPSIISFHLLPSIHDTPMRIDVVPWAVGSDLKMKDVDWPLPAKVDITEILKILLAGYCGPQNYNIWLSAVDSEVRLKKANFENMYLKRFKEVFEKVLLGRGYRRFTK